MPRGRDPDLKKDRWFKPNSAKMSGGTFPEREPNVSAVHGELARCELGMPNPSRSPRRGRVYEATLKSSPGLRFQLERLRSTRNSR